MNKFVQTLIDGLTNGSIYASLALALVLVHRATHIPNFAQGEMAMVSAYIAWEMQTRLGDATWLDSVPDWAVWLIALIVSMIFSFALGFAIERGVIRWVENASPLTLLIITLGLLSILNNGAAWKWSFLPKSMQSPFPIKPMRFGEIIVSWQSVGIVITLVVLMVLVACLFSFTKVGLGMRAAAGNAGSAKLVGINVGLMLAIGWGLSAVVGSAAGVTLAPKLGSLTPNLMGTIMVFAFAGAVLGGFDSAVGAVLGGLFVGLLMSFTGTYWQPHGNQLNLVLAFVVIAVVLLFKPNGVFGKAQVSRV